MSICDSCIHDDVCGLEDNHEEGMVSCADRIPKDVLDKIRAEITRLRDSWERDNYHDEADALTTALAIIDKYKAESEET